MFQTAIETGTDLDVKQILTEGAAPQKSRTVFRMACASCRMRSLLRVEEPGPVKDKRCGEVAADGRG